jgi:hypothetical protein
MRGINATPFVHGLYRVQLHYQGLTMATAIVKASFEVTRDGELTGVPDPLAIVENGAPTSIGPLESDIVPIKYGCDFAIYGEAVSPEPVTELDVGVRIGAFERRVRVSGARSWVDTPAGIRASAATPFTRLPLDYAHAYGGEALHEDDILAAHAPNPDGLGYIALQQHAVGTRLPNVEEVDQRLTLPIQQPMPAGLLPLPRTSTLRGLRGVDVDLEAQRTALGPMAFVWSHPRMHLSAYPESAAVSVRGMTVEPEWRFSVPRLRVNIQVRLGDRQHVLSLTPDTLCLVPERRRLWVVLRRAFIYQVLPQRRRELRFELVDSAGQDSPTTTIAAEMASAHPQLEIASADPPERMPLPFDMLRELHPLTRIIETLPLCLSG